MRYRVDDNIFNDIESVLDYCIQDDYYADDDYFSEWVNDLYGSIEIAGDTYYAYDILDNAGDGNMAYLRDQYCENMNDNDQDDAYRALRNAEPGEEIECQNYVIHVLEDEDEDEVNEDKPSSIEQVRRFIEEQNLLKQKMEEDDQKNQDDIMNLFQVIS